MRLGKVRLSNNSIRIGAVNDERVQLFDLAKSDVNQLSDILHADEPKALLSDLVNAATENVAAQDVTFLAPLDAQEVWAAGVTYKRSKQARMEESEGAARFYDLVYEAKRPELFFKATPHRVVGPGEAVRVRADSQWSVPEPELGLVLSPALKLVGFTIGNDMSARDIEGENPLYLPQAKVYNQCCALGPVITTADALPIRDAIAIGLSIERDGNVVFDGSTNAGQLARSFDELIGWLGRENSFPNGVILLTGTGIVPPDEFTLQADDRICIDVAGIGVLDNHVVIGQST